MQKWLIVLFLSFIAITFKGYSLDLELNGQKCVIENPSNPTIQDYESMQQFLQDTLNFRIKDIHNQPRRDRLASFKLYNPKLKISPYFKIDKLGKENSKDAIICYCSQNEGYLVKLERLKKHLKMINFDGHFLYHVGGWPNTEGGCISHFVNPYMFKPCAFLEAKRLGYKRVLWIDLSVIPLKNLNPLFDYIKENGIIFRYHHDSFRVFENLFPKLFNAMKMTDEEKRKQIQIDSRVLGLNLESKLICEFLDSWHQHGINGYFFLSSMPEEFPMSILLNRMGIVRQHHNKLLLRELISWDYPARYPEAYFLVRYELDDPVR